MAVKIFIHVCIFYKIILKLEFPGATALQIPPYF